ncbi:MAG TPA: hypothetical protein VF532_22855 [Candidatus Angelobacter sp.]
MTEIDYSALCPVCGYDLGFKPWDGEIPSDEICPSCGIQFGYADVAGRNLTQRQAIYEEWRRRWIEVSMTFSEEKLLTELDRDPDQSSRFWATELKNGKEAYAFLMKAVRAGELNVNQMRNALHALFRIRDHGSRFDVLETFIGLAGYPNKAIRSEAVQLAVGLVRFSTETESVPIVLSEEQRRTLREAMALGLTPRVAELAREFLGL